MDQRVFRWKRPFRLADFRSRIPVPVLGGPCPLLLLFRCPMTMVLLLCAQEEVATLVLRLELRLEHGGFWMELLVVFSSCWERFFFECNSLWLS